MTRIRAVAASLVLVMPILGVSNPVVADDAQLLVSAAANQSTAISDSPATSNADMSSEDEILRLFNLYRDARSARMLEEADPLAKQIVDLSIRANGIDSKTLSFRR